MVRYVHCFYTGFLGKASLATASRTANGLTFVRGSRGTLLPMKKFYRNIERIPDGCYRRNRSHNPFQN